MRHEDDVSLELIIGKTVKSVTNWNDQSIVFECNDDTFEAYHMQDCCESVSIYDISGDLNSLAGKTILWAYSEVTDSWPTDVPADDYAKSFTWTTHVFHAHDGVVVRVRWLGTSNGYYSESVYFGRTHKPIILDGQAQHD